MRKLYLLALATAVACASSGSSANNAPHTDRNVILQNELSSVPPGNLFDVIQRLRPNFLQSRGQSSITTTGGEYPTVYMDGRNYGDIGQLRQIISTQVETVRYYDAPSAQQRFGMISGSGVIEVISKR
jgi:hypothetical protein